MIAINAKLLSLVFSLQLMRSIAAAQPALGSFDQPPTRIADALRQHGIDSSRPSVIAALQSTDPEVRSLAAHKLAEDRDLQSVPSIETALTVERDPEAGLGIASALWSIGDHMGLSHMETMCTDRSLPLSVIAHVVHQLAVASVSHPQPSSTGKCAEAVLGVFDHQADDDDWLEALTLLPVMHSDVPRAVADRMVIDAQNLLADKTPAIRMAASHALAEMGAASSTQLVRSAMSREADPVVRLSFKSDLATLEKSQ